MHSHCAALIAASLLQVARSNFETKVSSRRDGPALDDARASLTAVDRDRRNPKDSPYVPFAFNGKISKLTFNLGPERLFAEDLEKVKAAALKAD
jgi:hypothetical protein